MTKAVACRLKQNNSRSLVIIRPKIEFYFWLGNLTDQSNQTRLRESVEDWLKSSTTVPRLSGTNRTWKDLKESKKKRLARLRAKNAAHEFASIFL